MQWFYIQGEQRIGPVEESELFRLVREGRLAPGDLIWNSSMGEQWRPASSVLSLWATSALPVINGRRGFTPNRELMSRARSSLRGHWALAVGITLLYQLVLSGAQGLLPDIDHHPVAKLLAALIALFFVLIIAGPMAAGWNRFFLTIARREDADAGLLFAGFKMFGKTFGTYFLLCLFLALWGLFIVIPVILAALALPWIHQNPTGIVLLVFLLVPLGIVSVIPLIRASLAYSLTFLILVDQPGLTASELIDRSKQMMAGFKWKRFCLGWRFFGWALLAILTCGIGMLWLTPYMATAHAHFYDDLRGEAKKELEEGE